MSAFFILPLHFFFHVALLWEVFCLATYIPEEKISEIRNSADIVHIISEGITLKKAGRNFLGLCPFHTEKTPSFSVSPEKQIFYCFGCGVGGNVFGYIMKREGLSFPEAARQLAKRYGIDLPDRTLTPDQKKRMSERESLMNINQQAMNFYHKVLLETPAGKRALAYLAKRGMDKEIITRFLIGYATDNWDRLTRFFENKRVPMKLVEKSGLIISRKSKNGFYDRFRDRVIFPIFSAAGQVIGFGGRVLDDSLPKYLNSPETPVYNKSRNLFGLYQARNRCREKEVVYIVEGYFDLIALHQNGIENSVATLGTALTTEHARMLKGLVGSSGKVILLFDSDEAGLKAAERCIEIFDKEYVNAQILILPAGHDPDSYLMKFGSESFRKLSRDSAKGIITFLIDSAISKYGLSLEAKIKILSDLQKPLAALHDKADRLIYIKELSERIQIEESAILEKIRAIPGHEIGVKTDGTGELNPKNRLERQIVAMMLQFPESIAEIKKHRVVEYIRDDKLKTIGQTILEHDNGMTIQAPDLMTLIEDQQLQSLISDLTFDDNVWDRESCIKQIKQFLSSRDQRASQLKREIAAAEKEKNYELLNKLLQKKQALATESDF